MDRKRLIRGCTLFGAALLAPLMAGCMRHDNRMFGPPVPDPLSARQAAEVAQSRVGDDADLDYIDDLNDGHLFAVSTDVDANGRPFRTSRLLFVHDDGTVAVWPGR